MQDQEFRRNCELRAMDEPVSNQQALEALNHIVKNPQRDSDDIRTMNQAVSVLENFIHTHAEIESKARVYKAAVDQLAESMAGGVWQDGPAPKDGSWILGLFHGLPYVVAYDSWEVGGETLPDGSGSPPDGYESGWCLAGDNLHVMDKDEPEKWARIIHPNRHMPASWDGPRNRS